MKSNSTYLTIRLILVLVLEIGYLVAGGTAYGQTDFYVGSYGAVGNGSVDDEPAIQSAITAAEHNGNARVVFGTNKVYLLNAIANWDGTTSPSGANLLCQGGPLKVSFIGNHSILLCTNAGTTMLMTWGEWQNSTIQDLTFTNTHGVTTTSSTGLSVNSVSVTPPYTSYVTNNTITGCTFSGFSEHLIVDGAQNMTIVSNTFLLPSGRDSGSSTNANEPNVAIRLFAGPTQNPNSTVNYTRNVTIAYNYYNGCSTPGLNLSNTVTKGCGDGMIFADNPLQLKAYGNRITNCSVEAIYANLERNTTFPYADIIMTNEYSEIDSNIVDNSTFGPSGFGVSANVDAIRVHHNIFNKVNYGLWAYDTQNGFNHDALGLSFHDNTLVVGPGTNFFGYAGAVALQAIGISQSEFYSNSFTLLGQVVPGGTQNYGIDAGGSETDPWRPPSTNLYIHDNVFAAVSPGNGYPAISVGSYYLSNPPTNFINNTFESLQLDVQAQFYPMAGYPYPNTLSDQSVQNIIHSWNTFKGCSTYAGMVSWWKGEGNANDSMNGNNGTFSGSYTTAEVGLGFLFNGANHVEIADNPVFRLANAFTIELWYKDTGSASWYGLIAKRASPQPVACNFGIDLLNGYSGEVYFMDGTQSSYQILDFPVPTANVFHHLAATYQQTDATHIALAVYVDGQYQNGGTFPGNMTNTWNSTPVTIGDSYSGSGGDFLTGIVDEVSIYCRALSASEIEAIYASGAAGKCNP